jgi:hypothetical protein
MCLCGGAGGWVVFGYYEWQVTAPVTAMTLPKLSVKFSDASEPLRLRAPSCDEQGKALSDFMMLVPGLRDKPGHMIDATIRDVHITLTQFSHAVVFAEFNLKLNLLWVSIRPIDGIRFEIASAIQAHVPEAKLVSHI